MAGSEAVRSDWPITWPILSRLDINPAFPPASVIIVQDLRASKVRESIVTAAGMYANGLATVRVVRPGPAIPTLPGMIRSLTLGCDWPGSRAELTFPFRTLRPDVPE